MNKANSIDELLISVKNGRFTLDGSHLIVDGYFDCSNYKLVSLIGMPKHVNGHFYCSDNRLISLEGAPEYLGIGGSFYCSTNKLISLEGAPREIDGNFVCTFNKLTTLEGAPEKIGGSFYCSNNNLSSLHNVHKHINKIGDKFYCAHNPIKDAMLGLLLIDSLKVVKLDSIIDSIINKYLPGGSDKTNLYKCAQELVKAGYPELAKI